MITFALDELKIEKQDEDTSNVETSNSVVKVSVEVIIAVSVTALVCLCIFCVCWNCRTRTPPPPLENVDHDSEELISLRRRVDRVGYRMSNIHKSDSDGRSDSDCSEDTRFLKDSAKYIEGELSDFVEEGYKKEFSYASPRKSHSRRHASSASRKQSGYRSMSKPSPSSWKSSYSINEHSSGLRAGRSRNRSELEHMHWEDSICSREEEMNDDLLIDGPLEVVDMSNLDHMDYLATGSFSTVNKMEWKREGCPPIIVAVKLIENEKIFRDELKLANIPHHKNVVKFLGRIRCRRIGKFGIVMPFYENGNLRDLLKKKTSRRHGIQPKHKRVFMIDIAKGLAHLHKHKIIHRDIGTRNILITKELRALISDFGFSRTLLNREIQQQTNASVGSMKWMAPEALKGKYSEKSDVYSFGMTCYEILEQRPPFYHLSGPIAYKRILKGDRPRFFYRSDIRAIFPGVLEIVESCWAQSWSDRPTMHQVANMLSKIELSSIYQSFRCSSIVSTSSDSRYIPFARSSVERAPPAYHNQDEDECRSLSD